MSLHCNEWLKALKVDDQVIVDGRHHKQVGRVTRFTKTQIIVSTGGRYEYRFRRRDGFEVNGDIWSKKILREASPEAIEEIINKAAHNKLCVQIGNYASADYTLPRLKALEEMADIMNRELDEREG